MKRLFRIAVLLVGVLVAGILATNALIYLASRPYIYAGTEESPEAQTVLVPGAAVSGEGELSPIFIDRLEMGIALYKIGKVSKILVSGDNSTDIQNEVNPARLYLIERGIPDEDIFLDHAGFDTYSSMYRARDVFGVTSILISTQSFHLPRAVFIARRLGLEAFGVNADVGHMLFRNYVREVLANEKAMLNLLFNRKPKFLGEPVPVEKDGRDYL
ncbi:MAG: ElyC/SanA/YdcF family protein [Candidatus Uhrbacteria bacterium]|nr:ElyC/SanA/YdcF family protein [Candidatus Uhrbacteria bacterium]MDZ4227002.1 ElyC/SanA/YdcF family protein [Patescibacteria group bacterium]